MSKNQKGFSVLLCFIFAFMLGCKPNEKEAGAIPVKFTKAKLTDNKGRVYVYGQTTSPDSTSLSVLFDNARFTLTSDSLPFSRELTVMLYLKEQKVDSSDITIDIRFAHVADSVANSTVRVSMLGKSVEWKSENQPDSTSNFSLRISDKLTGIIPDSIPCVININVEKNPMTNSVLLDMDSFDVSSLPIKK